MSSASSSSNAAQRSVQGVIDPSTDVLSAPNSSVYDLERARAGARINSLANAMRHSEQRAHFAADRVAYMTRLGLTATEQHLVLNQDWQGLVAAGGSVYNLVKLGGAMGVNLVQMGLQMRNQDFAAFMQSRPAKGA